MPSISVDVDEVLADCTRSELRRAIRVAADILRAGGTTLDDEVLSAVGTCDADMRKVEQASAPPDIQVDTGERELIAVLSAANLTRHAKYVARTRARLIV